MKRLFWLLLNALLVVMMVIASVYLYRNFQDWQLRHFIKEKEELVLKGQASDLEEGNIGSTHVVATIPKDPSGQRIIQLEQKIVGHIRHKLGYKKPSGKIKNVLVVHAKEGQTNFKKVRAHEIHSEQYAVQPLQVKKEEEVTPERVLLTEDQQLFTLGDMFLDLNAAKTIMVNKLQEKLTNQGVDEAEKARITAEFQNLDLETVVFSYANSQLVLALSEEVFQVSSLELAVSDFFSIMKGDYLADVDKANYDQFFAQNQVDKKALRQIALTFDDGPNPATTPVILDLLKKYNAKATFFVLGSVVEGNEAILQRMVAEGHEVANHTWSHSNLTHLSPEQVQQEIELTQAIVEKAIGKRPTMMRPPFGAVNQAVVDAMGLPSIYWNVDTEDWLNRDSHIILERVKQQACPGCIILMHDIHQSTVDNLEPVLQFLTSEGYNLVTVTELLGPNLNPQHIYYDQEANGPAQH
ncbi:TPA: polysaccharide deacetylase family protein [Streptococcus suis]